ncbi:MAG: NUDIX hydrolase [Halieaceae bacterium]|jgi:8-oxo-dGTP pyrophosphatase MutT (NUDIX family)|nr:NUDIX hydrolase [Halieaceae bacterium]
MTSSEKIDSNYISKGEIRSRGRAVRPKDAATLIIVRRDATRPTILMGKRASGHKFMPNKFVFPGGRVDPGDSRLCPPLDLHPAVRKRLMSGCSESRARALGMAAIRETFEETGLILGEPHSPTVKTKSPQWREFLKYEVNPRLDTLHLIARAITPPYRNRRFDARFFMVDADLIQGDIQQIPQGSGELLEIHWVSVEDALALELPTITRMVLGEVEKRLADSHSPEDPGPFVYFRHGKPVLDQV